LTGFSKRKQERRKKALQQLEEKARQERAEAKKQFRDSLIAEKRKSNLIEGERQEIGDDDKDADFVQALAGENEKVDQIVDDFSAHAFGSALVTVTTTVPADESAVDNAFPTVASTSIGRLPKNAKITQGESARLAMRLKDKLKGKKQKNKSHQHQNQRKEQRVGGRDEHSKKRRRGK
jgi:hypothetical protein